MIRLTVSEIAQAVNGRIVGDANLAVEAGVEFAEELNCLRYLSFLTPKGVLHGAA